jgi:poly(3-hydroxybutyrate) depolymerase
MRLLSSLVATAIALTPCVVHGLTSNLTPVTNFNSPAGDADMYVYIPATVKPSPAIVVAIHSCERDAQYYYETTPYAQLADINGFIVIYPNSSAPAGCWDVSLT